MGGVQLRPIRRDDLQCTLAWRNREDARVWFKTSTTITIDQHLRWFEAYLDRADDLLLIVDCENRAVGQLGVYNINTDDRSAEVGRILVATGEGGKGYMRLAFGMLLDLCVEVLSLRYLYLEVRADNVRAKQLYERTGFFLESSEDRWERMGKYLP